MHVMDQAPFFLKTISTTTIPNGYKRLSRKIYKRRNSCDTRVCTMSGELPCIQTRIAIMTWIVDTYSCNVFRVER